MIKLFTLLGGVIISLSAANVGWTQPFPMPTAASNHFKSNDSSESIWGYGCSYRYDYNDSYRIICREVRAYRDAAGDFIEVRHTRAVGIPYEYSWRTLRCNVKRGTWEASAVHAAIRAVDLDPSATDCSTEGYSTVCGDDGCPTTIWTFSGPITVSGSWSSPEMIQQSSSTTTEIDNLNGYRRSYECTYKSSYRFSVGGWSFQNSFQNIYYPVGEVFSEGGNWSGGSADHYDNDCITKAQ